jgi:tetraacyldisaccharide 4'-kinase
MNIFENKRLPLLLTPLSWIYGLITEIRNCLYDWGILKTVCISDCYVVSVGNISVGGTGKTPAVVAIAQHYQATGKKVAILSRGYRRSGNETTVVSDGQQILTTPDDAGDEPYLLALKLPGIPVVSEPDRVKGARLIMDKFEPDVIVLDDAFQHRRIHRDLDVVLIDCSVPLQQYHHLPAGIMREHWRHMKRADLVFLTRVDQSASVKPLKNKLKKYTRVQVVETRHVAINVISLDGTSYPVEKLRKGNVGVFSGIGNPDSFRWIIERLSGNIISQKNFKDHHSYTRDEIELLVAESRRNKAEYLITTEKDIIKIRSFAEPDWPIFYLTIQLHLGVSIESILPSNN